MEHLILNLGALVAVAALMAVVFRLLRQSSIVAYIVVGVLLVQFQSVLHISPDTFKELVEAFTELGIILLLFMAGVEVEFESIRKRWPVLLWNGVGQVLLMLTVGTLLGWAFLDGSAVTFVYFGLCLTLSSTIVVLDHLRARKELESYHGQIILGIMVLQDIVAVVSLVFLKTLSGGGSMVTDLGMIFLKMFALAALLFLAMKFALVPLFRYLARAKDILFLGSLGWVLGIAALCEYFHFSPEIGAFMAGAALSFLPYRLEVQDKVEPIKDFGVMLFFVALGYGLPLADFETSMVPRIAIVVGFVFLGTPLIMLAIGYACRQKSRPTFMIGAIINQISEFSLILATLALRDGIFDRQTFLLVTLSTIVTIFLSSMGQQAREWVYDVLRAPLSFLIDRRVRKDVLQQAAHFKLENHVVIAQYNELAETLIEFCLARQQPVLLLDLDPDVYVELKDRDKKLLCPLYLDISDPDTWEDAQFGKALAIVSCIVRDQRAELGILRWLREKGLQVPFVAATDSHAEAVQLYAAGATYVIQTEELAAERLAELLGKYGSNLAAMQEEGKRHEARLKAQAGTSLFKFL